MEFGYQHPGYVLHAVGVLVVPGLLALCTQRASILMSNTDSVYCIVDGGQKPLVLF